MRITKRGIIEVQFNWIFVLIAGFIIFLFILSIVFFQQKNANDKLSIELSGKIGTSLRGKEQLPNTYNEISIPRSTINFYCDEDLQATFKIDGSSTREQLPVEIIFSDNSVSSNTLQVWTQDFDLPFIVTRFMYLSTPQNAIIIYHDDSTLDYAKNIYSDLPSNTTKILADSSDISQKISNYANYKIVCFNSICPPGHDYLKISPNNANMYSYGNLEFHKNGVSNAGSSSHYLTSASLFGAIFSNDKDYYECEMNRAFSQFEIKKSLHEVRLNILQSELSGLECANVIFGAQASLSEAVNGMNLGNVSQLYLYSQHLTVSNSDLQFKACPLVY